MVGSDHIMVGTDYPFDPGDWMAAEKIQKMECTGAEREAMLHGNASKLLKFLNTGNCSWANRNFAKSSIGHSRQVGRPTMRMWNFARLIFDLQRALA